MNVSDVVLHEVATQFGLDDPGRYELWRARLEEDQPLVDLLRSAEVEDCQEVIRLSWPDATEQDSSGEVSRGRAVGASVPGGEPEAAITPGGSVRDRVERLLDRAGAAAGLNCFTTLFAEEALAEASIVDEQVAAGKDPGPLAGTVVAVKDLMDIRGHRTTGGTRALQRPTATEDAPAVARLRRAGAVVIGATNLHALAYGALSTSSDAGTVGNPLLPEAIAGGSSGGSAAAVAAGLCDVAVGTDTAGSIRIPAALCGVVGLKPTYGRVPTAGVQALGPTLDHVGPLAGSVAQVAAALEAMSDRPFRAGQARREDLRGVVVGLPSSYVTEALDPQVRAAHDLAVQAVTELGGRTREVDIPSLRFAPGAQLCLLSAEAFDVHQRLLRRHGQELPEDVRLRLEVGMFRTGADYVRAQRYRALLEREMGRALAGIDVLLTPTVPVPAPRRGQTHVEVEGRRWTAQAAVTRLTCPFNLTGQPALTLPWSGDAHAGSIGIQLAGRPMDEMTVLSTAAALEQYRRG